MWWPLTLTLLVAMSDVGMADSADYWENNELDLEYDAGDFASARTFNLSLDGVFNNSLFTIGALVIVGIILFGMCFCHFLVQ